MPTNRHLVDNNELVHAPIHLDRGWTAAFGFGKSFVVDEGRVAVITEGGAYVDTLFPGTHALSQYATGRELKAIFVETRELTLTVSTSREFTIARPVPVSINLDVAITYRVSDFRRVACEVKYPVTELYDCIIQAIRSAITYATYDEIRTQGEGIAATALARLKDAQLPTVIGVEVLNVRVIRLQALDTAGDALAGQAFSEYVTVRDWMVDNQITANAQVTWPWLVQHRPEIAQRLIELYGNMAEKMIESGALDTASFLNQPTGSNAPQINPLLDLRQFGLPGPFARPESPVEPRSTPDSDDKPEASETAGDTNANSFTTVAFSAYYPRTVKPDLRYVLIVYAYIPSLAPVIGRDVSRFEDELGGTIPNPKTSLQHLALRHGTKITVVPESDEIVFEPSSMSKRWKGGWIRFEFDFSVQSRLVGEVVLVRVSIQVEGIEHASINNCAIEIVSDKIHAYSSARLSDNSLALAELEHRTSALYNRIFISYSHKDEVVARAYRLSQVARGDDVFLDTESIRSGEDWRAALAKGIMDADIVQLFWSENSAASPNVRDEWDFALKHKCPEDQCRGILRPVYWQKPMPTPPPELAHLNFRFVPFADATKDFFDRMREEVAFLKDFANAQVNSKLTHDAKGIPNAFLIQVTLPLRIKGDLVLYFACATDYPASKPSLDVEVDGDSISYASEILRTWSGQYLIEIVREAKKQFE